MATTRTPIVFMGGSDPVEAGVVKSFARPGGNITGIADLEVELVPKRMEIFYELIPSLKRVLFVYDATNAVAGADSIKSVLSQSRPRLRLLPLTQRG